jgi:hypothetical protein
MVLVSAGDHSPGRRPGPGAAPPDPAAQSARHARNQEIGFPGERAGGQFIAFWLRGGRVAAGMNASVWDMNEHVQALARSRQASGWLRWPIPAPAWRGGRRLKADRRNDHGTQSQSATAS